MSDKFLHGLDISSVQGVIPWEKMSYDYRFVIAKSAEGNDGFDPNFFKNVEHAKDHGIYPGAYHFAYPLPHIDPKAQAQMFFDKCRGFGTNRGELPPFLDLEWPAVQDFAKWGCTPQQISDWARDCLAEMHRLWGCRPYLYIYPSWWDFIAARADVSWAAEYELWMASYPTKVGWPTDDQKPYIPKPFSRAPFWQFDGNGGLKLPSGVDSDFCVFDGEQADLDAIANGPRLREQTDFQTVTVLPE